MSLPGRSPSKILREALLQFSRDLRRSRRERRRRRRERSRPPTEPVEAEIPQPEQPSLPTPSKHTGKGKELSTVTNGAKPAPGAIPTAIENLGTLGKMPPELGSEDFDYRSLHPRQIYTNTGDVIDLDYEDKIRGKLSLYGKEPRHQASDLDVQVSVTPSALDDHREGSLDEFYHSAHSFKEDPSIFTEVEGDVEERESNLVYADESVGTGCCKFFSTKYGVAFELTDTDGYAQSKFIQKVFGLLLLKAVLILAYLTTVDLVECLKRFYAETFYYHLGSIGIYFIAKITIRLTKICRRRTCFLHLFLLILDIVALADFLAGVMTQWLEDEVYFNILRKILYSIGGTFLFFIYVGWFVAFDMRDGIMLGSSIIITLMTSVHQVLHGEIQSSGNNTSHLNESMERWTAALVVFGVTQSLMAVIMLELRSILLGNRYSVLLSDWFFTGVYII